MQFAFLLPDRGFVGQRMLSKREGVVGTEVSCLQLVL